MTFEQMWRAIAPIGRSSGPSGSGGYFRRPWASAELELRAWFREQASARDLTLEEDPFGNLVAWWGDPSAGDAVLTGSHLDSVPDGGAYDGPLGVVSAFAAIDTLAARDVRPARALGVAVFVEEEGSRFGRACLGSRLATGAARWEDAAGLVDADGVRLGDLTVGGDAEPWLERVGRFVELHVEQGRGLVDVDAPVGVASAIWPHGRWRFEVLGRADHAGTTRMEDRADPMMTFAMTALAASKQARLAGQRATFGRVEVHPNGTNAIPSRVTGWLDARGESADELTDVVASITRQAEQRARRDGTRLEVHAESVTGAVTFDADLASAAAAGGGALPLPMLATQAGHDAGILQAAGIPSAMLFVRNPTGISHSPDEFASLDDCLAGVNVLVTVLERLLR